MTNFVVVDLKTAICEYFMNEIFLKTFENSTNATHSKKKFVVYCWSH